MLISFFTSLVGLSCGHHVPFSQDSVNYFRSKNKKNVISKEVVRIYSD